MMIQCMICLSKIFPSDSADLTNCGHVFHTSCFDEWRLQSATCPQCRASCTRRNKRRFYFNTSSNELQRRQEIFGLSEELLKNLECIRQLEFEKYDAATSEINCLKMECKRLANVEKELKKNTTQLQAIDDMKRFISSSANELQELMNEIPDKLLAGMVINLKKQLITKQMKRKEVLNALKVCRAENLKLNVSKRQLCEKVNTMENDNNKEN